jgi:hypothetical protein
MSPISTLGRPGGFRRVVVVTGHMTDTPDRAAPRFPESQVDRVRSEIGALFDDWGLGADDLLICGGARGGDLIGALQAHARGATAWVLLSRPADEFVEGSVAGADPAWIDRYWWMLQRAPSWELTSVPRYAGRDDVYAAANEWMLETAVFQSDRDAPNVVAIWDGLDADGVGGTGHMVESARVHGAQVEIIKPFEAD